MLYANLYAQCNFHFQSGTIDLSHSAFKFLFLCTVVAINIGILKDMYINNILKYQIMQLLRKWYPFHEY